mmetsp:Transcript_4712/g.17568  ORF Transcript_4712/g.17568 Transcript_4712/m.17568 type:complete len:264 (+) Transcript_4712:1540-2331(+)
MHVPRDGPARGAGGDDKRVHSFRGARLKTGSGSAVDVGAAQLPLVAVHPSLGHQLALRQPLVPRGASEAALSPHASYTERRMSQTTISSAGFLGRLRRDGAPVGYASHRAKDSNARGAAGCRPRDGNRVAGDRYPLWGCRGVLLCLLWRLQLSRADERACIARLGSRRSPRDSRGRRRAESSRGFAESRVHRAVPTGDGDGRRGHVGRGGDVVENNERRRRGCGGGWPVTHRTLPRAALLGKTPGGHPGGRKGRWNSSFRSHR